METADERRGQGSGTGGRGCGRRIRGPQAGGAGSGARTPARPQDHGARDPQRGSRSCTGKKTDLAVAVAASGGYPVKRIAETLGVARSNLIERAAGKRRKRGPQTRAGDAELTADIRRLVDTRPSYGYRRIAALLKRERRAAGLDPVNAKRVYRLMKKSGLLLARHTGRRVPRAHDGTIMTSRSNERWCSDALEFTCWNGDVVRVAFALDSHDREVISWVATTAGISGEMIRDMMVQCVEQRFGDIRAPHKVQWLTDNGSIFAANRTLEIAAALNLEPCFTPVETPRATAWPKPNLQAQLYPHQSVSGRPNPACTDRSLDGGFPAFPAGLSPTARVHCGTSTSRLSGLTGQLQSMVSINENSIRKPGDRRNSSALSK